MLSSASDPIIAIATAPGRGAVGMVRVSGKGLLPFLRALVGRELKPREATYGPWRDAQGQPIDQWVPVASIARRTRDMQGDYAAKAQQITRTAIAPALARQAAELTRQRATATGMS
mgnify:CR=1 FL=1